MTLHHLPDLIQGTDEWHDQRMDAFRGINQRQQLGREWHPYLGMPWADDTTICGGGRRRFAQIMAQRRQHDDQAFIVGQGICDTGHRIAHMPGMCPHIPLRMMHGVLWAADQIGQHGIV